ncbi:putative UBX domain protein [Aspergillus glaucus CBS 516.65]|uniref:UBX domain-containing protein n=1 Tax=Aspergillus glaucus CBS 516.65 TaxID=1160497 RepID=A0A1L9VIP2_ASPGL|nr:hypothetical protein ASPGLDRAFT_150112 [Aspergillus glaucus CBS 516.65]OJJ83787.1 hypothetical protein ASPGLDRAFT_150112 [Aspergillus glaucus CBS 516.65]
MSSHVVVIDSTARRATIKTSPGKYLTDVLQEACAKLGAEPSQCGLKHNSKQLDLSLAFRLTGLTSGAKLELVQLSRSPSVVTVAIQLPESEARGVPNGRLLDKFPSSTTLWHILRKFEAGVAGGGSTRNLTARGVPSTDNGGTGAGRLFYEIPVLQTLGREMSTFADLQKSLAQLGFNSGNILLRLSFRRTEEPLKVAMVKIQDYFKVVEDDMAATTTAATQEQPAPDQATSDEQPTGIEPSGEPPQPSPAVSEQPSHIAPPPAATSTEPAANPTAASRPITVFSPPTSSTPQSAQFIYNDNDYVPSVEHAQAHQRRLNETSRPQRLPTDAEIAAKESAEAERLASVKEVDVKVRLPDQSQVVAKFGQSDTGKSLYDFVRSCLAESFAREKFLLAVFPAAGGLGPRAGKKLQNVVPDSERSLLIKNLNMVGRVLVSFSWDPTVSSAVRGSKTSLLKSELQGQAQQLKVEQPAAVPDEPAGGSRVGATEQRQGDKPARKPGTLPKWLKLPGKK